MAVRVVPLASGSSGNATLLEFGRTRILVDAGVSALGLVRRLEAIGVAPSSIAAILLTHEHHDHAQGLERFSFRQRVPVATTPEALAALDLSPSHLARWCPFDPGATFEIESVRVTAFPVPHDAVNPVGFVLEGEGIRVGIATDLGHATTLVVERLKGCDVLMVEANHDDRMLVAGPYPWHLKQRVGGRMGHLSNEEAAGLLSLAADDRCRAVVLAHLSEKNNEPGKARDAAARALSDRGLRRFDMRVAERRKPTPAVVL